MIETLLLALIPAAAWGGWILAKSTTRRGERKRNRNFSNRYFQGLNYLLDEQPDKAIAVFIEMAEVTADNIETHLALGSLFRRRGEVERAIRVHQNIISKPGLAERQKTRALLELGEDYMRAGLFDRAENLFKELIERDSQAPSALRHLLDIYQQEKDWEKALQQAQQLEAVTDEKMGLVMVQDPKTAKYEGMPYSAIETGLVDFIDTVENIAAKFSLLPKIQQNALSHSNTLLI